MTRMIEKNEKYLNEIVKRLIYAIINLRAHPN